MNVLTKAVIGGRERPAISSHTLAPVYPDKSHAHLLTKMRNALSNMDEAFKAENVKIIYLKGPAKRWSEVQFTEAGAYKFLAEYEESPYPQLKKFAGDARPVVAAHFAAAGPDKWAAELDALKADNVRLSDELARARYALEGIAEDRDAYKIAADESHAEVEAWKAKLEQAQKEAEARAEFDRARILGLEASIDELEERLHIGEEGEEEEDEEGGGEEMPTKSCSECVPRIESETREEEARMDRRLRTMRSITEFLLSHTIPPRVAAVIAVEASHGLGNGGLAAFLGLLKQ